MNVQELIVQPLPDTELSTALAKERLVSLVSFISSQPGDEADYLWFESKDDLAALKKAAGITARFPAGVERPKAGETVYG